MPTPADNQFLDEPDLQKLTGYKQPAMQLQVLRGMGLQPALARGKFPRITWAAINTVMAGQAANQPSATQPNFEGL